jgi:diguanylate cyclase (GGDEF)-like protein
MLQATVACGTLAASAVLTAAGDPRSPFAFLYLGSFLYAACVFDARAFAAQAAWAGSAYAGALALVGGPLVVLSVQWLLPTSMLLAGGALVHRLVSGLRRGMARLRHAAGHDPLTGLANRALVAERLGRLLRDPGTGPLAVAFVDLDDFKPVNDRLGHAVGDALLVAVAERLRGRAGACASLARFGGDEFVALVPGADWDLTCRRLLRAFDAPFIVGRHEIALTASFGVATARAGDDVHTLIRRADAAVYQAKRSGRAQLASFDELLQATGFVEQSERERARDRVLARLDAELAVDGADV